MMTEKNEIETSAHEGIKIERERKYPLKNAEIANKVINCFSEKLTIPLDSRNIDKSMHGLLWEIFQPPASDSTQVVLNAYLPEDKQILIVKKRLNYYIDTNNNSLDNENITFNLRQRDKDWIITIKLLHKSLAKKRDIKGIFERIEFNCILTNDEVQASKIDNHIDLSKLINNNKSLRDLYDLRVKPITKDLTLQIKEAFNIQTTRVLYPLPNDGLIQLSVDNIYTQGDLKDLYEMEIELAFGSNNSWLDNISTRVFSYLCEVITLSIKDQLKGKIEEKHSKKLFSTISYLTKKEKVKYLSTSQFIYQETKNDYEDLSQLSNELVQFFQSDVLSNITPFIFCPFWLTMPRVYNDVKPPRDMDDLDFFPEKALRQKKTNI